ncbi:MULTISPECIES: aminotransferase class V-fold PLP-dependent enzyme [Pseudomonas]|jgi:cysteine desulfurase / selenocysteine lyase|uniref:Aminotransferase class V-fold PLP-dependent enzyme n=2 Tax=Pseudomonas TaxID=286 RepID=A0A4Y9TJU6_PSEFL|nr:MULTISPECIES: aminotransferase class V-fold PLP-dependent enzyme [Pseudomonas]CRM92344.1 Cysteine desulfurase [Pseudomonas sp. 22 E 5]MCX9153535.1 aminotransferase class V-fold PLP-dependent enzyme [Pseudomonas sp. TB1-B1]QXH68785.1 aminotransferase class V-fold PLP-dependent enzyme [Pseudomonas asgharzadehiana]TFW42729.1 aminotransferase class V-fold PLP-dependent enzyme [Pseudomonas fluorescens]TKJ64175.1 aminotransferase class V-fold PLP-dependent enzyme [Pseudomonas sp. CFBP13506]
MSPLDVRQLRAATPGCQSGIVHFNHAGASLPSQATLDAIIDQLQREARDGPMEAGEQGAVLMENARSAAAQLLNAPTRAVAFAGSGSAAWNMAFQALGPWQPGDRILVGRHEWGGNLASMQLAVQAGARVEVIPCDETGAACPLALASMIDAHVKLIDLTWLPANSGLINPAQAIGEVARRHAIPYFIDAGQAVGQVPVDVQALHCDVLKSAGRKHLRGPRGTALLYVRPDFLQRLNPAQRDVFSAPWSPQGFDLRDDARRFETSEVSFALLAGLGNALQEMNRLGIERVWEHVSRTSARIRAALCEIPGICLHDLGAKQSGLIAFNLAGWDAFELKRQLGLKRINIGANGVAYTPLDMQARGLPSIARISVSPLNNDHDIERLMAGLRELRG